MCSNFLPKLSEGFDLFFIRNLDNLHLIVPFDVKAVELRAIVNEVNLPFFELLGAELVELWVGSHSFYRRFRCDLVRRQVSVSFPKLNYSRLNDTKLGLEDELLGCELLVKRLPVSVRGSLRFALMVVKRSTALRPVALRFGREFLEQLLVLLLTHSVPREFVLEHSFMIECD